VFLVSVHGKLLFLSGFRLARRELGGFKQQSHAVIAKTLPGGRWAIIEHMAVVTAAMGAVVFGAWPDQVKITLGLKCAGQGSEKAGPAGAAVKLHLVAIQGVLATGANKDAWSVFVVQTAGAGWLGAFFAQDFVSLRGELGLPFGIADF
jgi:hypothetical protein